MVFSCFISAVLVIIFCLILVIAENSLSNGKAWAITLVVIFLIAIIAVMYSIWVQPENQDPIHFKVSISINIEVSYTAK